MSELVELPEPAQRARNISARTIEALAGLEGICELVALGILLEVVKARLKELGA